LLIAQPAHPLKLPAARGLAKPFYVPEEVRGKSKMKKKYVVAIVVAALLVVAVFVAAQFVLPRSGGWSSAKFVTYQVVNVVRGKVSALSDAEIEAIKNQPLEIGGEAINFNGGTCAGGITSQMKSVTADDYLASTWQITQEQLGITADAFQVVTTNCSIPSFKEYVRLATGQLIVPVEGAFFIFEPKP
jgi:hypothetical protein